MPTLPAGVKATVDLKKTDEVVSGLRYISSVPFVRKAFNIPRIKQRVLDYLRSIFPVSDPRWEHVRHLVTGFRAYDIPENNGTVGFVIQHSDQSNIRTAEILGSLEEGSRGYYQTPQDAGTTGYGRFTFHPGDQRGNRHGGSGVDFAMRKRIHIPARPGIHYMRRTYAYLEDVILEAKPEFFRQVKAAIKNKTRS